MRFIITLITSLILLIPASGKDQWEIMKVEFDTLLGLWDLRDVQFLDQDKGFILGGTRKTPYHLQDYERLYKTENGGKTWNHIAEDFDYFIVSIHFVKESRGYATISWTIS